MLPPLTANEVPTLGTLESHILADQRLSLWERETVLGNLQAEVGQVPKNTPLASLVGRIGGGLLGWLIAKYFGLGGIGQVISTAAGYGIGSTMSNFYNGMNQLFTGDRSSMVRRWGQ